MATGKILRFDEIRGYGFIAPDSGGEDVFLHANALLAEKHQYHPGVPVEFDVIEGERGLKATAVRVIKNRPGSATAPSPQTATGAVAAQPTPATVPAAAGAGMPTPATAAISAKPVPSPAVQAPSTHGAAAQPQQPTPAHSGAAQPHTSATNGSSVATAAPPVVTPATVAAATSHAIAPQRSANGAERTVREGLSPDALSAELVELCLESVPSMTGEQITQLRRAVVVMARRHGWVNE